MTDEKKIKITFVVPAYNEERFLSKTLESILEETKNRTDCEIIVVNNASSDKTKEIALGFPSVKVIDEPKKGLPKAREAGFRAAQGELIANIDADTVLLPGWLNIALAEFERNPRLVCVSSFYRYEPVTYFERALIDLYCGVAYVLVYLIRLFTGRGLIAQGGNSVIKKSALERIGGYDTSIEFYGEDADFALRLSRVGDVAFTWSLKTISSSRRLKEEGILRFGIKYLLNYFSIILLRKPAHKEYKDHRI